MSSSSSSSHGFRHRVNNQLCTCRVRRIVFDPEIEHDWYRYQLFDMYNVLNPHERHQHQAEMIREERIQDLT
ncbi:hypothetical protein Tco_0144140 [Tanacetum coccineum]